MEAAEERPSSSYRYELAIDVPLASYSTDAVEFGRSFTAADSPDALLAAVRSLTGVLEFTSTYLDLRISEIYDRCTDPHNLEIQAHYQSLYEQARLMQEHPFVQQAFADQAVRRRKALSKLDADAYAAQQVPYAARPSKRTAGPGKKQQPSQAVPQGSRPGAASPGRRPPRGEKGSRDKPDEAYV